MTRQELEALKRKWQSPDADFNPYWVQRNAKDDITALIEALEAMLEIERIDVEVIEALTKQRDTLQEERIRMRKLNIAP